MTMKTRGPRTDRNAEDDIARLCRAAGATVQRVSEDDNGWDLLAEFPPQVETAFPDVDPPLTRCLIQVKSCKVRRKSTSVKLSNALKFAKDGLPCFVALVTYPAGPRKHEAIYLRHIWATDMAQALRKAREASSNGLALNRIELPVTFSSTERVDDEVAESILDAINREGVDYAGKKKLLSDSLGYENGWGNGHLVLADGHNELDLQDLLLGMRDDIPIDSFTITENRFGIPGPKRTRGPGRLSVELTPTSGCVLTLQRRPTGERLTWIGSLINSGMHWLPRAEQRLRITAGPMELLVTGDGQITANWSAPSSTQKTLDELERDATFRSWMDGSAIDLEIWTERGALPSGTTTMDGTEEQGEEWRKVVEAIQAVAKVVPPELRPADMTVSMDQFLSRLRRHEHLAAILKPVPTAIRVVNDAGLKLAIDAATHIVFPWVTRLPDYFIVAVIEREIIATSGDEKTFNLTTTNGRLLRGTTLRASEATDALVANEVQWARERAQNSDNKILSFHPEGDGTGTLMLSIPD